MINPEARAGYHALGEDPADALRFLLSNSPYRRAAVIGLLPMAVWGMTANDHGLWWHLTPQSGRRPLAIVREARREVAKILETFEFATLSLPIGAQRSHRLARHIGFSIIGQGMAAGRPFLRLIARHKSSG